MDITNLQRTIVAWLYQQPRNREYWGAVANSYWVRKRVNDLAYSSSWKTRNSVTGMALRALAEKNLVVQDTDDRALYRLTIEKPPEPAELAARLAAENPGISWLDLINAYENAGIRLNETVTRRYLDIEHGCCYLPMRTGLDQE